MPPLHANNIEALKEKVNRRRVLIGELVRLEAELLDAGAISRRVVMARSVVHGERRYVVDVGNGRGNGIHSKDE